MKTLILIAVLPLLAACGGQTGTEIAAIGQAVAPIIGQAGKAAPILSEIAAAGCAAQAAANAATAVASSQGNTAWTANFSKASQLAGVACAW